MRGAALILLAAACSGAPIARAPAISATEDRALGMNDVSILLPLPRDLAAPVIGAVGGAGRLPGALPGALAVAMIAPRWFDALVGRGDIAPRTGAPVAFEEFHIVAVRFDLCDRAALGACPAEVDGRLRLVLQPLYLRGGVPFAHDIALHAFYPIPRGELAGVVEDLRRLAAIQRAPRGAALGVSPAAAAGDAAYLAGLRALVTRYARADQLARLTVIGQVADSAAFAWLFRGLDRRGDDMVPIAIPGIAAAEQSVQLAGGDTVYRAEPVVDLPAGFALAINGPRFAQATGDQRAGAVAALAAVQNPSLHNTEDTQCIGCHLATFLTARRAATTGIDPAALPAWFAGPAAPRTIARDDPRVVRAFGWAGPAPAISQRVVNDTAEVLAEIEARFPAGAR